MKTYKKSITQAVIHFVIAIFCITATLPFVLTIMVSISDENSILKNGYRMIPEKFSLNAYRVIFMGTEVFNAYKISIIVTVLGVFLSVTLSAMMAFSLSMEKVKYRNIISMFIFITMIFNPGLVPWYIFVTKYLHLKNSILALILPILISPYNVFLLRNYFKSLPVSLTESAEIEGATPFSVFLKIILPISTPIIATISLFYALSYWNDWSLALWLIDKKEIYPLQYMLFKIQSLINYVESAGSKGFTGNQTMPKETVQMATVLVTIGPIILVYPFIQKYFVKGIMVGAVKG